MKRAEVMHVAFWRDKAGKPVVLATAHVPEGQEFTSEDLVGSTGRPSPG